MAILSNTIGTAGTYATIQAWINAIPDLTGTDIWKGVLIDNKNYDEEITLADPLDNTSISSYIWLDVDPTVQHDGTSGTGARNIVTTPSSGAVFTLGSDYTRITNLEIGVRVPTSGDSVVHLNPSAGGSQDGLLLSKCLINGDNSLDTLYGVYAGNDITQLYLDDCSFFDIGGPAIFMDGTAASVRSHDVYAYHCGFYNCGFISGETVLAADVPNAGSSQSWNLYNCVATDGQTGNVMTAIDATGTLTWNGSHNAFRDTTPTGGTNNLTSMITISGMVDSTQSSGSWWVVKDAATPYDFRQLDTAAGNALHNAATNRQSDGNLDSRQDLSVDAAGTTRPTVDPDIGAYEFANQPPDKPTIVTPTDASTVNTPVAFEITYSDPDGDPQAKIAMKRLV